MNVFDFVNAINFTKQDLFEDPQAEKTYVPFVVNRSLSYFQDTVLYANTMNMCTNIPKEWQFDFLRHSVPKRKRFSRWTKKDAISEDVALIQEYYKYSLKRALEVLPLLTNEQLNEIRSCMYKGGNHAK